MWSRLALLGGGWLVCSPSIETDDNWNMKICDKKQYMCSISSLER
jgi:hypothetical protein